MTIKTARPTYQIPVARELNFSIARGSCNTGAKVNKVGQNGKSSGGKVRPMNICYPTGSHPQNDCTTGLGNTGDQQYCGPGTNGGVFCLGGSGVQG